MARKKPAKKAKKTSPARHAARKPAKKTARKPVKKSARKPARKSVRKSAKKAAKKPSKKAVKRSAPKRAAKPARRPVLKAAKKAVKSAGKAAAKAVAKAAPKGRLLAAVKGLATAAVAAGLKAALAPRKKPNLDRPRKTVADVHGIPSSLDLDRSPSAAKSGRAEMREKLARSNSGGAAITAGDVDADWQSAESVGDEAPGGDNPTPDQDVVDDIGRALGVEYADDEELQGGAEITERDAHRWELDPSSKDDFEEDD